MSFWELLDGAITKNNSLLCVGLDPDFDKIPKHIQSMPDPLFAFNKKIIDQTHDLVCSYKPNSAFYEAFGAKGLVELQKTCEYIHSQYPHIPVIIDAKRGDIGNTNEAYAQYVFDYLKADAITVMPYMGIESLSSYFKHQEKGVIIGCHSSNTGAKEFQELHIDGKPLYQIVAEEIIRQYPDNLNCMIFFGATYPKEIEHIRQIIGNMTILAPGIGAQEGDLEKVLRLGLNAKKRGIIINASRSIIYASQKSDFAEKARMEAEKFRTLINNSRNS